MTRADRLASNPRKNLAKSNRDRVELEHVPADGYWIPTAMDLEIGFLGRAYEAAQKPRSGAKARRSDAA
jgi:hypothetical protein